jgi:hypothetical protein
MRRFWPGASTPGRPCRVLKLADTGGGCTRPLKKTAADGCRHGSGHMATETKPIREEGKEEKTRSRWSGGPSPLTCRLTT